MGLSYFLDILETSGVAETDEGDLVKLPTVRAETDF